MGHYAIEVRPAIVSSAAAGPPNSAPAPEYARVPVRVAGEDISGIAVTTAQGAVLRGRVLFDTGAPPADAFPNGFRVAPYYTETTQPISIGQTTMRDDWTFEVAGVVTTGLLRLAVTTTGWSVKSVAFDGKDITETPMVFEPGREYKDIQVTLTKKRAEVNGTVVDARDRPTQDYVVVFFPQEPERWFPRNRNLVAGRPDQNGRFRIITY